MTPSDIIACMPTYNRPELTRASLLSLLAFGGDLRYVVVIDDHSDDPHLQAWLRAMESRGWICVVRKDENTGVGASMKYAAQEFTHWAPLLLWMDADTCIGPLSLPLLLDSWNYWDGRNVRIGMLSAMQHARYETPESDDEFELGRWRLSDLGFVLFHGEQMNRHADTIHPRHRRPMTKLRRAMEADGYNRYLCVKPKVPLVHMGQEFGTIEHPDKAVTRWIGVGEATREFPESIDRDWFIDQYPRSAMDVGNVVLDMCGNPQLVRAAKAADEAAWGDG